MQIFIKMYFWYLSMTEKETLLANLIKKSDKSETEVKKLIADKVNELSGLVSEEGAIYIIANELGIKLDSSKPKRELNQSKIEEIKEPKTPVSLVCKVIKKYDKVTFSSQSGTDGNVQSVLVGDDTGIIRVVFWNDKTELLENVVEGDILKIINAYTRENTNSERIEIHFGQYSDIEVNPKGVKIELKEFTPQDIEFTQKKVNELEEGNRNIKISGIVASFDIPRFYFGCPQCYKKVFQDDGTYKCAEHEEVKALKIPIVNVVIDDGTGSITLVGFRDRAESLTGIKTDEILKLSEDIDRYNDFSKKIVGSKLEVGGNVGLSSLTGDKQILTNQVMKLEIKDIEEIAEELVEESKDKKAPVKKEVKEQKKETKEADPDIDDALDDLEVEEIDFDDDVL